MPITRRTVLRTAVAGAVSAGATARTVIATARDRALVVPESKRPAVSGETYERLRIAPGGGVRLAHGESVSLQQPWYLSFIDREFAVSTDGLQVAVTKWRGGGLSTRIARTFSSEADPLDLHRGRSCPGGVIVVIEGR